MHPVADNDNALVLADTPQLGAVLVVDGRRTVSLTCDSDLLPLFRGLLGLRAQQTLSRKGASALLRKIRTLGSDTEVRRMVVVTTTNRIVARVAIRDLFVGVATRLADL